MLVSVLMMVRFASVMMPCVLISPRRTKLLGRALRVLKAMSPVHLIIGAADVVVVCVVVDVVLVFVLSDMMLVSWSGSSGAGISCRCCVRSSHWNCRANKYTNANAHANNINPVCLWLRSRRLMTLTIDNWSWKSIASLFDLCIFVICRPQLSSIYVWSTWQHLSCLVWTSDVQSASSIESLSVSYICSSD